MVRGKCIFTTILEFLMLVNSKLWVQEPKILLKILHLITFIFASFGFLSGRISEAYGIIGLSGSEKTLVAFLCFGTDFYSQVVVSRENEIQILKKYYPIQYMFFYVHKLFLLISYRLIIIMHSGFLSLTYNPIFSTVVKRLSQNRFYYFSLCYPVRNKAISSAKSRQAMRFMFEFSSNEFM